MHCVEASWDWVGLVFSYFGHPFNNCLGAQSLSIVSIIYKAEEAIIGLGTFAVGPHIIQSLSGGHCHLHGCPDRRKNLGSCFLC